MVAPSHAKLPKSVEAFWENLSKVVSGPQPFMQFSRTVDPLKQYQSTADMVRDVLRKEFRGKDAKLDMLYRNDDSDVAVTLIATIWAETQ